MGSANRLKLGLFGARIPRRAAGTTQIARELGAGNPALPSVMASWDLSALKAAQQRSFVGASAVGQPRVMASDPVGKEHSKLFAKS